MTEKLIGVTCVCNIIFNLYNWSDGHLQMKVQKGKKRDFHDILI